METIINNNTIQHTEVVVVADMKDFCIETAVPSDEVSECDTE